MNLQEMMDFVRLQADTDTDDAPTANLTIYARAGYNDIKRRVWPWKHLKVNYTVSTVAGDDDYAFSELSTTDLEYVSDVVDTTTGGNGKLTFIPPHEWDQMFAGATDNNSKPSFYTVEDDTIYLHPTPDGVYSLKVRGYRQFVDWPAGTAEPDLPREFDEPICWYMLGLYYAAQEDGEAQAVYMTRYEQAISSYLDFAQRGPAGTSRPWVMAPNTSRVRGLSYERWVKGMVEG